MLSIRSVLMAGGVLALLMTSVVVGGYATVSTRRVLERSWQQQVENVADRTSGQIEVFLARAEPTVQMAEGQADAGLLDLDDPMALLDFNTRVLRHNPGHTWFSWADEQGTLASALWWPSDQGPILSRDLRLQTEEGTWERRWEEHGGEWLLVSERWTDYDPRGRPYYRDSIASEGVWTSPYVYLSRGQAGVSYVLPSRDDERKLRGAWSSDFECGPIADYLASLRIGQTGRAYLVDAEGVLVAHPDGVLDEEGELLRAQTHPDPWLRAAWSAGPGSFAEGGLVGAHRTLDSGPEWTLLVVLPKSELYATAQSQERQLALFTALLLILALGVAALFARRFSEAVSAVEQQMKRIARFELNEVALADYGTVLREVRSMGHAHDRMKEGLRSFARYVPQQLVQQLMQRGEEAHLGGEERVLTVLFCDIAGFTTLMEGNEPMDVLGALTETMTELDRIIEGAGGTVVQYLGDAILAVWGAPEPMEHHALRATQAAMAMRERVDDLVAAAEAEGRPALRVRIGLHTGPCIVGNVGSEQRFSYTVLGEAVHRAEQVQDANKVHGTRVLLTAETAAELGGAVPLTPRGELFSC